MTFSHILYDGLVHFIPGMSDGSACHNAAECDDGNVRRAAADIRDHAAGCTVYRHTRADRRCHRFLQNKDFCRAHLSDDLLNRSFFDFGDAARHTNDDAEVADLLHRQRGFQKRLQHIRSSVKIRNHAVLQRSDNRDIGRRFAQHRLGLCADCKCFAFIVDRDDGGLVEHDAAAFDKNQCIGCSKVDPHIFCSE